MSNDLEAVRAVIAEISSTEVEGDGLQFDAGSVQTERISLGARYEGVCANVRGQLGTARIVVRIDLGFSDVVTPGPRKLIYPTLLDFPAPELLGYSLESAIAEKVESMVTLGEINSRTKDFFDVWALSRTHAFDRVQLKGPSNGLLLATRPSWTRPERSWRATLRAVHGSQESGNAS